MNLTSRSLLILATPLLLLSAGCKSGEQAAAPAPAPKAPAQTTTSAPATPAPTEVNLDALMKPTEMTEEAPDKFIVDFTTTAGEFTIECYRDWSPEGADRFYNLVKNGFYNEVRFFRVVPGFMVQFGIHGNPAVTAKMTEARIQDDPVVQSNLPGYISFAKQSRPHTRTSQVFINYGNNSGLDGQGFSPFGKVISGMESVKGIYSGYRERPSQGSISNIGNSYLQTQFPELDYVLTTTLR